MKRNILSLTAAALFGALVLGAPTKAHVGIPYVWGEHVSHVADLPEHESLKIEGKTRSSASSTNTSRSPGCRSGAARKDNTSFTPSRAGRRATGA